MWKLSAKNKPPPFSPEWRNFLEQRVALYDRLPKCDRPELENLTQKFLTEKNFEGCGGLSMTDEIKVVIAAQGCVLLLHRTAEIYPDLYSVLVYPSHYRVQARRHIGSGIFEEREETRSGEAWTEGSVVLSWDRIRAECSGGSGHNLVLHEFAHLLDYEDGWSNGLPSLGGGRSAPRRLASWQRIFQAEFEQLRTRAEAGEAACLDFYGATNPAEFFAVATEAFFVSPNEMKTGSPNLYREMAEFYRQDPALWSRS